jgi:hypothetical protein
MDRLYYLTDERFEQINRLLPPEDGGRGRPAMVKNRQALEGILPVSAYYCACIEPMAKILVHPARPDL